MTVRPPYTGSLIVHVVLILLVLTIDLHAVRSTKTAAQHLAARAHRAAFQQKSSATYAERLKKIREVIEHLDAEVQKKDEAKPSPATPEKPPETAAAKPYEPKSVASKLPEMEQLWRDSRREYETVRERYIEQKAKRLAELTQMDLEKARSQVRTQVDQTAKLGDAASNAGAGSASETAAGIAAMHGDAQRMLGEMLRGAGAAGSGGVALDVDTAREAYQLSETPATGGGSPNSGEAVDMAPIMLSRVARVNSVLDTPEDQKRLATLRHAELRNRFNRTAKVIRFTRRLGGADAVSGAWVTPDAWYVIGPFPNHRRENIETRYPPEIEIDRDAVYEGRDGRVVSWEYIHASRPNIRPPHMEDFAVYYAYTEITCTTAKDCWLAIGSDDYSKVWVNGFLVWHGTKNEKVWNPTEGFCRVHLDEGVNRFLVRLENGINGCEFSVIIALE